MKTKTSVIFIGVFMTLTACSNADHFSIVADQGQIGGGAKIVIHGDTGHMNFTPLPDWPSGMDDDVIVVENTSSLQDGSYAVETGKHVKLSFLVAGGRYICHSCQSLSLPVNWHREIIKE